MTSISTQIFIRDWLHAFAAQHTRDRDDVHVDQINAEFQNSTRWWEAGVQCFRLASAIIHSEKLPMVIAVEFFLAASPEATGPSGERLHELDFSWTPPALTIFRKGAVPWEESDAFLWIETAVGLPKDVKGRLLYQEWFDESEDDYDRRLWLVDA